MPREIASPVTTAIAAQAPIRRPVSFAAVIVWPCYAVLSPPRILLMVEGWQISPFQALSNILHFHRKPDGSMIGGDYLKWISGH